MIYVHKHRTWEVINIISLGKKGDEMKKPFFGIFNRSIWSEISTLHRTLKPSANARQMLEEVFHNHLICSGYNGTIMGGSLVCDINTKLFWQRTTHHPSPSSEGGLFKNNRLSSFSSLCQLTSPTLSCSKSLNCFMEVSPWSLTIA